MSMKIASAQLSTVAARSAVALRTLSEKVASLEAENQQLRDRLNEVNRSQEIESIAEMMEDKGLNADMTFEEKVAHIRASQNLENVKEAVKMASAGSIRIASVSDSPGRGIADPLTSFCLGND